MCPQATSVKQEEKEKRVTVTWGGDTKAGFFDFALAAISLCAGVHTTANHHIFASTKATCKKIKQKGQKENSDGRGRKESRLRVN